MSNLKVINNSHWIHTMPAEGSLRYNPATGEMEVWDGRQWMIMTGAGPASKGTKFVQKGLSVYLIDQEYWSQCVEELEDWLDNHVTGGSRCKKDPVINFDNMEDLLVFTLKWS